MIHSRTMNDLFLDFKLNHRADGVRWRDYWGELWIHEIDDYLEHEWHLFPLPKFSKKPFADYHWNVSKPLTKDQALYHVGRGDNLAVIAWDMVLIEADQPEIGTLGKMICRTRTSRTPRGWRFFLKPPFTHEGFTVLKKLYPFLDVPRTGPMYALVPLSTVKGRVENATGHDIPRLYEWVNRGPMLGFETFVHEAIK